MRRLAMMILAVAGVFALAAPPSTADSGGRNDRNDTRGRLDLARVAHGHSGDRLVHRLRTYGTWRPRLLRASRGNRFLVTVKHAGQTGTAAIYRKNGRWWCKVPGRGRGSCASMDITVKHPNPRTLVVKSIPADWSYYKWRGGTRFKNRRGCSDVCVDWAPRKGRWITHRL